MYWEFCKLLVQPFCDKNKYSLFIADLVKHFFLYYNYGDTVYRHGYINIVASLLDSDISTKANKDKLELNPVMEDIVN